MPRARKRAASPVQVEEHTETDHDMEDAGNALQFNEPLTWKAGKPIAVSDLLRRLKTLAEELQSIDQGAADRESLVPKAQELANVQLLGHKDGGVKAWTMLCIVEMFRLLAPDAPYKGGQLKQIFDIFVSTIVPALASPTDPYSQQNLAILTSLTTIKSIVLLTDIPGSDRLILNLFNNCFDVMSGNVRGGHGETLPKNVEYHMTNMLCTLVDECVALPNGVIDIILAQFLRADPSALAHGSKKGEAQQSVILRETNPAYNMARSVCNTCAEKMSRAVGQYFSSVLIDASEAVAAVKGPKPRGKKRTHDESEDESDDGLLTPPAETDFEEVAKAHRLLRELWRSSPDVVQNIVPQMEAEVAAENVQLRTMAVQTVGDMISGIGAAGPPPPALLDPSAWPSQSLETSTLPMQSQNALLEPAAPHVFSSVYPAAYQAFVDRHRDKAAVVRSAWTTAAGLIVWSSGGGKGLDTEQESQLLRHLSDMLVDQDERVRLAAIQAVARLEFSSIMQKLGSNGGLNTPGSVLCNLADRIKDRKHHVRIAATELLARIWGVAAGTISEGSERVRELLGGIPTRIFMAFYVNDLHINALVLKVTHESLLPVGYPPIKPKPAMSGDSQRVNDSQAQADRDSGAPDAIRAERILVLVRDLEDKARAVFFMLQHKQTNNARYMESYLTTCTEINSAVSDDEAASEKATKKKLGTLIQQMSKSLLDPTAAAEHLHKFAKHHDRRSYQLIRFCYSPESDYRKIFKAIKELRKRMEDAPNNMVAVLETMLPLVYSASILVYNRSHVPAIMDFARTDEKGLGAAAHEVLKEISTKAPEVFKVHVHELCEGLKKRAPSAATPNDATAVDELKACAGFADRFSEDMPKDREFYKAMTAYAMHGVPPEAAKHAVTVIVASAQKREMYIKELLKYCVTDFQYGAESFLSRLAALSQLRLVANKDTEDHADAIMEIAVKKILGEVRTVEHDEDPPWTDEIDDDLCAKLWALRILVNGLRGVKTSSDPHEAIDEIRDAAAPVYRLLNTLIDRDGELSKTTPTAKHHNAHLRLAAANQLLKLSCNRVMDQLLTPLDFNRLTKIVQDPLPEVRAGFAKTLRKYLGLGKLPNRFYGLVFLYAFEPKKATKESTTTWLKSRAAMAAKTKDTTIETVFSRFLSLLAHHQDFSPNPEDLEDFVEYIMYYLTNVATETNLPLIYHTAQRLKSVQDGIDPAKSENLYILSDLAEAVIRCFQDVHGWALQLYSGKARLPSGIFAQLPSHAMAQEIADKRYLPDELADKLEDLVKASMRPKKRKLDGSSKQAAKKAKPEPKLTADGDTRAKKKLPVRKAPKAVKTPRKKRAEDVASSAMRKSARSSNVKNYAEDDSSDDDEEMVDQWQSDDGGEGNKENVSSSTPPTSDPTPAPPPPVMKVEKAAKKTAAKPAPQRSTRATRGVKSAKEKDIMDVPSDSDLSDVPSDVEA
ncbi:hypothetical protein LTR36_008058 [Oleoguttula mirabilis]|uniref:Uncharacterized protein n=1 Tax=Oleoguttula mirabilis TaxID=1507867 RepID=A0AAV9JA68_9PEZI|nr:hypothetical protein LTR36_008058 [Oleoguttula mirabilis]